MPLKSLSYQFYAAKKPFRIIEYLQHTCSKRGGWGVVKGRLNNVKKNALLVGVGFPNGPPSNAIHFSIQQIGEVEMSHVKILQFTPKNMSH